MNEKMSVLIGKRLRALRQNRGLSLEAVSEISGVSKPMLGKIERGETNPTVSTLWKVATGLDIPFTFFTEEEAEEVTIVRHRSKEPIMDEGGVFNVYPLFPKEATKPVELYEVQMKGLGHYQSEAHQKGVEEYVIVQEGELSIVLGQTEHVLHVGDAIRFKADVSHRYENNQSSACVFIMTIYYHRVRPT